MDKCTCCGSSAPRSPDQGAQKIGCRLREKEPAISPVVHVHTMKEVRWRSGCQGIPADKKQKGGNLRVLHGGAQR